MVRLKPMSPPDEKVMTPARHQHEVIGHQSMPPLHEIKHALTLADPTLPDEKQPHAIHICQGAMQ
jgi:hypothetical protein